MSLPDKLTCMPLSDAQLEQLANDESARSEFKESLSDKANIKRTICAFANDLTDHRAAGVVFIGLRADGTSARLTVTEELERTAAAFRSDGGLLPMPSLLVRRTRIRNCDVLAIEVEPAAAPPVRLGGIVWVRVGSTNQKATPQEERRLIERVRWSAVPFDRQPVPNATLNDIDLRLFESVYLPNAIAPEVLDANERSNSQQLASLRLATSDGRPSYAGILVLGKDVRQWLPGAYVQFVRFDGQSLSDPIRDHKELDGPLSELLRQLDDLIDLNVQLRVEIGGRNTELVRPDYPRDALRQLVRNAVMHRAYEGTHAPVRFYWFSDRVEIHSPGGPFGLVNRQNFGQPGMTDYRNPQLAEGMRVLGYVQRFGWGIPAARQALSAAGNPPLEFQVEAEHVLAIVRRAP